MIHRRTLRTRSIKMLVLDESDEMLNKGFKEQIYDVYRYLPPATQVKFQYRLPYFFYNKSLDFMFNFPHQIFQKNGYILKNIS